MNYGYTKKVNLEFLDAIKKVREELSKEGFGVLTEIDVAKTLKKKLNVDYSNYMILGACNPEFAYKALASEKEVGLLLPCNVIIYEDNSEVFVSAINPLVAMSVVDNSNLEKIARDVKEKLNKVIDNIYDDNSRKNTNNNIFKCSLCGLEYKEEYWMKKCEDWCSNNKSCNTEIISHALNKDYKINN